MHWDELDALQDYQLHYHLFTSSHLNQTPMCIPSSRPILTEASWADRQSPSLDEIPRHLRAKWIGFNEKSLFEFGYRPNQTSIIVQRVASSYDDIPSDGDGP